MKRSFFKYVLGIASLVTIGIPLSMVTSGRRPGSLPAALQHNRAANPQNHRMVDSAINLLRTGDLVVRTGADMTSYMFSQMNQRDKTFSHCGLVIIEDGKPFIYHSIGGEDNPDEELRRDDAHFWFSPANNLGLGVVRLIDDTAKVPVLVSAIHQLHKEKIKFDMQFDLATDDRLYCAEFVYKVVNQSMSDPEYLTPTRFMGYTYVGIDDLFLNRHATLVCSLRFK